MWGMRISPAEIEELRGRPYLRRAFSLPDLSVVTAWIDGNKALRLTITKNPVTIPLEAAEAEGAGTENGP